MYKVLVVCTANICRSPVAQIILSHALSGRAAIIDSAGVMAADGMAADKQMIALMVGRGFSEISIHRSRGILPLQLNQYDLILCMEQWQVEWIHRANISTVGKTMLLGYWTNGQEVSDPVGQSEGIYNESIEEIKCHSLDWARKIIGLGVI